MNSLRTHIKICGLRTAEHALAAVAAGADMLGFIFAPARRQITLEHGASIARAVRSMPGGQAVRLVGVFVNETPERIGQIVAACELDVVQLSGDESLATLEQLPRAVQVFKTVRLAGAPEEQAWLALDPTRSVRLHVDAHVPGSYGGAGVTGDWERAAALAQKREIMLAGGLTPENVGAAIERVRPWAVDVSSGVERDGIKDTAKIHAFVAAARAASRPADVARIR
jgi:phosphoribosylanthranilate isomerase